MPKLNLAYAEQCLRVHDEISEGEFISDLKPASGWGGTYTFRSYGKVLLKNGGNVYVGQKTENNGSFFRNRVTSDIIVGSILVDKCPELLPKLPLFVGWGGKRNKGYQLTEDASKGGSVTVNGCNASPETIEQLVKGFEEYGSFKEVIDVESLNDTTVFDAGGQEKLLDLTPSPYYLASREVEAGYSGLWKQMSDMFDELRFDF